ncbi:hypothetical protein HDV04_000001 [Boothiomyces sp. JEL0838]|nr:hypothetical protein HDV04_000001 [Boothiomyces sp. JEL0838]
MPEKNPSPTKSDISNSSILDPPGYIKPSLQDLLLTDITAEELQNIAENLGVKYLGPAEFPGSFPVNGSVEGANKRLMVNLVCKRQSRSQTNAINIVFLIDTGSPVSYLSEIAIKTLIPENANIPDSLKVCIQTERVIQCHLSPKDKHFADVNVLGADFLVENGITLISDYVQKLCQLTDKRLI